jgi:hypothetical protein
MGDGKGQSCRKTRSSASISESSRLIVGIFRWPGFLSEPAGSHPGQFGGFAQGKPARLKEPDGQLEAQLIFDGGTRFSRPPAEDRHAQVAGVSQVASQPSLFALFELAPALAATLESGPGSRPIFRLRCST